MKRINEFLLVVILITTAVLAAAVGLKAYDIYDTDRRLAKEQEELELAQVFARNEEAQNRVQEMRVEIMELTEDKEELERFLILRKATGLEALCGYLYLQGRQERMLFLIHEAIERVGMTI